MSFYSPGGERPSVLHGTWLEAEAFAYPAGGFTRRAYVVIERNPGQNAESAPDLPYDQKRVVKVSIADTAWTIPARLVAKGKTYRGYVCTRQADSERAVFAFTPYTAEVQP